jgi:large subunit ribosomal protein L6
MSRIGRMPIDIPSGVTVTIDGQHVAVKGPKGELALTVKEPIEATMVDNQVIVTRPDDERASRSLHGLTRTLINNQILGVTEGFQKSLEVVGTGIFPLHHGRTTGWHHVDCRRQRQADRKWYRQASCW